MVKHYIVKFRQEHGIKSFRTPGLTIRRARQVGVTACERVVPVRKNSTRGTLWWPLVTCKHCQSRRHLYPVRASNESVPTE